MNLSKKKELAARTLNVGKERIAFMQSRLSEIKDAITKQDIRDLRNDGAIVVKSISGRKKVVKRKRAKREGNIRKRVPRRKKEYMMLTRKLRSHASVLLKSGQISGEEHKDIRKKIRNRYFRSKGHLKEHLGGLRK